MYNLHMSISKLVDTRSREGGVHYARTILSIIGVYEHKHIIAHNAQRTEHNIEFEVVNPRRACAEGYSSCPVCVSVCVCVCQQP